MKKVIGILAFMMMANSCGFLKKKIKVISRKDEVIETDNLNKIEHNEQKELKETDSSQYFLWTVGSTMTEIVGEHIVLSQDGSLQMARGKVNRIEDQKTTASHVSYEKRETDDAVVQQISERSKLNVSVEKDDVRTKASIPSGLFWAVGILLFVVFLFIWRKMTK